MIITVEMMRAMQDIRVLVNLEQLEDIELYEDGKKLNIPSEVIDEFKFTGLNNMDFITSNAYKREQATIDYIPSSTSPLLDASVNSEGIASE